MLQSSFPVNLGETAPVTTRGRTKRRAVRPVCSVLPSFKLAPLYRGDRLVSSKKLFMQRQSSFEEQRGSDVCGVGGRRRGWTPLPSLKFALMMALLFSVYRFQAQKLKSNAVFWFSLIYFHLWNIDIASVSELDSGLWARHSCYQSKSALWSRLRCRANFKGVYPSSVSSCPQFWNSSRCHMWTKNEKVENRL